MRRVRAEDPRVALFAAARRRAGEDDLPFNLQLEDIVVPVRCPVLGIDLIRGKGAVHDCSPTLDRIIPELGYVRGNIFVMSAKANRIKSNATAEEVLQVAIWLKHNTKLRLVA